MKRVKVGRYTYETDLPVKVGDVVLLPTPDRLLSVKGPTWEGTIASLTSDYTGPCSRVLRVVRSETAAA
jgi:hypothetical protein